MTDNSAEGRRAVPPHGSTVSATPPIVLVHGAHHGGWCWQRVRPILEQAGHRVYTPTQTGLADRSHLLSADIDMGTFVADIVNLLHFEDLHHVVLVGHSYGGRTISGVADTCADRLAHLVYLDGALPLDGRSRLETMAASQREARLARAEAFDGGISVPPRPAKDFGLSEPADIAWVEDRLTPQPLGPDKSRQPLQHPLGNNIPVTYLHCVAPKFSDIQPYARHARDRTDWAYRQLLAGHDAMVSAPEMVAEELLSVAALRTI